MDNRLKQARLAGLLYLLIAILAPLPMLYIPSQLINLHDMAEVSQNIVGQQSLFRLGISFEIAVCLLELLLINLLYQIFKKVNHSLAMTALLARLAMAMIQALNASLSLTILTSLTGELSQQTPLYLLLNFQQAGIVIWQIFFGLHLLVLGKLVYQSGYVHRLFGLFLSLASLGYLAKSFFIIFSLDGLPFTHIETMLLALSTISELAFTVRLLTRTIYLPEKI